MSRATRLSLGLPVCLAVRSAFYFRPLGILSSLKHLNIETIKIRAFSQAKLLINKKMIVTETVYRLLSLTDGPES
jgi:hypothetical protein